MRIITTAAIALVLTSAFVTPVLAQYPGEPKIPDRTYDPVYDSNYQRQWGMPNETVRHAQQKAKGLPTTTHLDPATLAALDVPASGFASPPSTPPSNFGAGAAGATR